MLFEIQATMVSVRIKKLTLLSTPVGTALKEQMYFVKISSFYSYVFLNNQQKIDFIINLNCINTPVINSLKNSGHFVSFFCHLDPP